MKGKLAQQRLFTFATIVVVGLAAFGLMLCLTSCSPGGSGASGTATTASSPSIATTSTNDADSSAFVGTWQLVEYEMEDGTIVNQDALEVLRAQGLDSLLILNEDGSAIQVVLGANYYGEWEVGDIDVDAEDANIAIAEIDGFRFLLEIYDTTLSATATGDEFMIYKRTDDVTVMPEEDYKAAVQAFAGTWHITSATRDGMTISVEDGQISPDTAILELTSDMHAMFTVDGEAAPEARWGITDSISGYVNNPVDGEMLTLSDGYLTLDMGEGHDIMTFVKE